MALQKYQFNIEPNHLYRIRILASTLSLQQVEPNIMVKGTVDIYGVNSSDAPSSLNDMIIPDSNKQVTGFARFSIIPTFIYCKGDATEIILSGIEILEDYGSLEG
jgi:hypothetical protein